MFLSGSDCPEPSEEVWRMRRLIVLFLVTGLVVGLVSVSHLSLLAQSESPQTGEKAL